MNEYVRDEKALCKRCNVIFKRYMSYLCPPCRYETRLKAMTEFNKRSKKLKIKQ